MTKRALALLLLAQVLALAACGGDDDGGGGDGGGGSGQVQIDPGFFADQRFDCDDATPAPECPPATCEVDAQGVVTCLPSCGIGEFNLCTVFQGPEGVDLCAPRECVVRGENQAPECTDQCAEDGDVTCYVFEYSCP